MGPGLTFVIEAQPYLNAVLMPLGLKVMCFKACTHYPTLFDHFQRELREVLQDLQNKSLLQDWHQPQFWKQLKTLANSASSSGQKDSLPLPNTVQGVLGMDLDKEELDAVPRPLDDASDPSRPIEFLVNHSQPQQEFCDTICNLTAISTSTGILLFPFSYEISKDIVGKYPANLIDVDYLNKENGHQRDAGSTASTAMVLGDRILVANVGNSRVVTSRAGTAVPLSIDHKPDKSDERQRIGGRRGIHKLGSLLAGIDSGTWRVGGVLVVSRAFGDKLLKPYVVADPEIKEEEIDGVDFIIIAGDGLWNVISNKSIATEMQSESKWKQMGELAMSNGRLDMAEDC
ncbi:hypothetical protein HN51_040229 [Arachis hypogaea]|nr:putative protein phosphatase 2C [Arachis hypogaea]